MKSFLALVFFFLQLSSYAQKDCEYSTNVTDTIGTYKATPDYLMSEKIFAGKSAYLFFSLVNENGTPFLKVQLIQKSNDFIRATCLDANSKIYLQLVNGKIITLLHTNTENCGTMLRIEEENMNTRITAGNFLFMKGSIEDLKASPVSMVRIKYLTETVDYVMKKEFVSELLKTTLYPENYFVNHLKCID